MPNKSQRAKAMDFIDQLSEVLADMFRMLDHPLQRRELSYKRGSQVVRVTIEIISDEYNEATKELGWVETVAQC